MATTTAWSRLRPKRIRAWGLSMSRLIPATRLNILPNLGFMTLVVQSWPTWRRRVT